MTPEISIIVAARNDDYGGNFLHRMQVFLNVLLSQLSQLQHPVELIIVEWNPPENEKPLSEALIWPDSSDNTRIRIIGVSNELHRRYPNSDRTPMFEYMAKNTGIRRAEGEYVLVTNPDIIFNNDLVRYISSYKLSRDTYYRIDRYDVGKRIPVDMPVNQQLRFCVRNAVRINTIGGISVNMNPRLPFPIRVWSARREIKRRKAEQRKIKVRVEDIIHTNASGDFILFAKDAWFSLRGYPELETLSHVDSYMCCMASASGLRQVILPSNMRIYHQEHDRSATSTRPMTSYETWTQECEEMLQKNQPKITNDVNWGLGGQTLEEYKINVP